MISNYTTSAVPAKKLKLAAEKLVQLYPDVPALGSPFNTGNETFGLSSQYKRLAAISAHYSIFLLSRTAAANTPLIVGDLMLQSQRRAWIQAADKFGVKTFGYLFTDPAPPIAPPTLGPAALDALGGENIILPLSVDHVVIPERINPVQ